MTDKECGGCPECNADLSKGLVCSSTKHTQYIGGSDYVGDICESAEVVYKCPDCGHVLTDSEEEADEFIRGD